MKRSSRRAIVRYGLVVAASVSLLAGCVGDANKNNDEKSNVSNTMDPTEPVESNSDTEDDSEIEDNSETEDDSEMTETDIDKKGQNKPNIRETSLEQRPVCRDTVVTFDTDTVTLVGCVTGSNGCHEPALGDAVIDGRSLEVTVKSTDTNAVGDTCTSVITENGYKLTVTISQLPDKVTVIHNDIDGEQTVTVVNRE